MLVITAVKAIFAVGEAAMKLHARSACDGVSREGVFLAVWRSVQREEELGRTEALLLTSCQGLPQLSKNQQAIGLLDRFFVDEMVPRCSGGSGRRMCRGVAVAVRQHLTDHAESYMALEESSELLLSVLEHTASHYNIKSE